MRVNPQECVYIGDSLKDIQAGKAAKMLTIGVTYGYTPKTTLINNDCPADLYVETPQELYETVLQLLNIEKKSLLTMQLMRHGMIFNGAAVPVEEGRIASPVAS